MIASTPVRLLSLAIVALVVTVGARGIVGGFAFGGDMLDTSPGPHSAAAAGERTPGVVAYVLDGDTVQGTLPGRGSGPVPQSRWCHTSGGTSPWSSTTAPRASCRPGATP